MKELAAGPEAGKKGLVKEIEAKVRAQMEKDLSEEELFLVDFGMSNAGFH